MFGEALGEGEAPRGECAVGTAGEVHGAGQRGSSQAYPVTQPTVYDIPVLFMGVEEAVASRNRDGMCHGFTQYIAVYVVVFVVRTHRRLAGYPPVGGTDPRTGIVRGVVIGTPAFGGSFAAAVEFVAVVVLAVTHVRIEGEPSETSVPFYRCERRFRMLELIGEGQGVEPVGAEIPSLVSGLHVEQTRRRRSIGDACKEIRVVEVGILDVSVASSDGTCGQYREAVPGDRSGDVGVKIAVGSSGDLRPHVVGTERGSHHVDRSRVGSDACQPLDDVDRTDDVDVDGQAVALVACSCIGEVDAVEKDHCLVVSTSPEGDVRLYSFSAPFPHVYRRIEPEYAFDCLLRRDAQRVAAVNRRGCHYTPRGIQSFGRHL